MSKFTCSQQKKGKKRRENEIFSADWKTEPDSYNRYEESEKQNEMFETKEKKRKITICT